MQAGNQEEQLPIRARRWRRFVPHMIVFLLLILPYSDNGCGRARAALPFVAIGVCLAAGLMIGVARKASIPRRRLLANRTLIGLLALLLWMDAGAVILALGLMQGTWWLGYGIFATLAPLILLCVSGWRLRNRTIHIRLLALWSATALMPFAPWNFNKSQTMLAHRVLGQSLEVVQVELDGQYVSLVLDKESSTRGPSGIVGGDLDIPAMQPEGIAFDAIGHGYLTIEHGLVSKVFFLYD